VSGAEDSPGALDAVLWDMDGTLVQLLDPSRIGVELSEELQLHPEQSTDAIVVHHPEAKYFNAT
jgi:cobalamin-dependent methionine synthase I